MTPQRIFPVETEPKGPFPLLIGLEGPPGGGKTYSALRLARGIQKVRNGQIDLIDTEAGRSSVYFSQIRFGLVRLNPPFRPGRFLESIRECIAFDNPACIVIDSLSDEHEGEGGVLDWHEEEVDRRLGAAKDDWRRREALGQAGWIVPKAARNRMIGGILRITTPLIFTFRAREKTKPIPVQKDGRTVITPTRLGYQAIAPAEICHAMTCMCLLPPHADGKPSWKTDEAGQDFLLKRPNFLAHILTDAQLDESTGEKLALWAGGGSVSTEPTVHTAAVVTNAHTAAITSKEAVGGAAREPAASPTEPADETERLIHVEHGLREAAEQGYRSLAKAWNSLGADDQDLFKAQRDRLLIPRAKEVDMAERAVRSTLGEQL
jgi:hypothetical protein